jgi:GntR family transcriptional regulator/MocR family aminotransferase
LSIWEVLVEFDRSRPRRGEQIIAALRAAVVEGRLAPGTRLPSTRDLAADLAVSRGLVVAAYEQLTAEGRLLSRQGSGTIVAVQPAVRVAALTHTVRSTVAARIDQSSPPPLRPGMPDLGLFPRAAWRRAYERALTTALDSDLGHGDPAGAARLRVELGGYLARSRAARVETTDLFVTAGTTQAFALVAAALRSGETTRIAVEDPGSLMTRERLAAQGLTPVPVPVDADGLDVAALAGKRVGAVLVTPAHQFPTGVILSPARRSALVDWARSTGGLVVEADYDAEFRYDREPVGCLQGLAPDVVALVGSVSRTLAPALRLGWLAAPPAHAAAVRVARQATDRSGPVLDHLALAELLAAGGYERHVRRVRRIYRERHAAAVHGLRRYLPGARSRGIAAGLHLTVELPADMDDRALVSRARAAGLGPLALSTLRTQAAGPPGLVVGYAAHSVSELGQAIRRLARVLRAENGTVSA